MLGKIKLKSALLCFLLNALNNKNSVTAHCLFVMKTNKKLKKNQMKVFLMYIVDFPSYTTLYKRQNK